MTDTCEAVNDFVQRDGSRAKCKLSVGHSGSHYWSRGTAYAIWTDAACVGRDELGDAR